MSQAEEQINVVNRKRIKMSAFLSSVVLVVLLLVCSNGVLLSPFATIMTPVSLVDFVSNAIHNATEDDYEIVDLNSDNMKFIHAERAYRAGLTNKYSANLEYTELASSFMWQGVLGLLSWLALGSTIHNSIKFVKACRNTQYSAIPCLLYMLTCYLAGFIILQFTVLVFAYINSLLMLVISGFFAYAVYSEEKKKLQLALIESKNALLSRVI